MFDILFRILEVLVGIYLIWSFTGGIFITYKSMTFNSNKLTAFDRFNVLNTTILFIFLVIHTLLFIIRYIIFGDF